MHQVLEYLRRPSVRSGAAVLLVAGVLSLGGTALARPASEKDAANAPVTPAAATTVKLLAQKTAKLNATPGGTTSALMTVGSVSQRARCTDLGSGSFEAAVEVKSSVAGTVLLDSNGTVKLTGSYKKVWTVVNTGGWGFAIPYDIVTPAGAFQHYESDFNVHQLGSDCVVRLAALSD
jgi:hypothetical protein